MIIVDIFTEITVKEHLARVRDGTLDTRTSTNSPGYRNTTDLLPTYLPTYPINCNNIPTAMSDNTSKIAITELSDYERTRAMNIERNNARLRALGLITAAEEKNSNDLAWKRRTDTVAIQISSVQADPSKQRQGKLEKRKRKEKPSPEEPARKSLRVQGKDPEGSLYLNSGGDNDVTRNNDTTVESIRRSRVEECRKVRQLAALRYSHLTDAEKRAAQENSTATYEHCLQRIRTMTDRALYNRIRTIERAVGKHCVVKMAIFKWQFFI